MGCTPVAETKHLVRLTACAGWYLCPELTQFVQSTEHMPEEAGERKKLDVGISKLYAEDRDMHESLESGRSRLRV